MRSDAERERLWKLWLTNPVQFSLETGHAVQWESVPAGGRGFHGDMEVTYELPSLLSAEEIAALEVES